MFNPLPASVLPCLLSGLGFCSSVYSDGCGTRRRLSCAHAACASALCLPGSLALTQAVWLLFLCAAWYSTVHTYHTVPHLSSADGCRVAPFPVNRATASWGLQSPFHTHTVSRGCVYSGRAVAAAAVLTDVPSASAASVFSSPGCLSTAASHPAWESGRERPLTCSVLPSDNHLPPHPPLLQARHAA